MSSSVGQKAHKIKLRDAVATMAAPTTAPVSTDPNWIPDTWRSGVGTIRGTLITILGSDGSVDIAAPVCVDVYHPDHGWTLVATLDAGAAVNVGDGVNAPSRSWPLTDLAAIGTAIQVHGGAISGGTITVWAEPLDVHGPR